MKNRKTAQLRIGHGKSRFALHPLSLAVCLAVCGQVLALPKDGTVVAGQATINKPTPTTQTITQRSDKAIIDWRSFSIAAGEKVRFDQPSATSITLNRVTGYDPSYLLGEMSSNGRIFLLNPYGVVFGAGARIDVGGMVASSLSLANNDFLAGRYTLTSVDANAPARRGEVRNEGSITAHGGTVALVAPVVSNTGTITADGGRVGMAAANQVSVDVEGDGLIFFQASASEASNRLQQLGRIQADGGSVELRAAARGAFADTVLNMSGVVQAKTLGTRAGKVVIDGGGEGIVAVSGRLDTSGAGPGQLGGEATVLGQRILIDDGARIDASASAGGGAVRIGGGFHGTHRDLHNAEAVVVRSGAMITADAVLRGDGGTVAIWSDGLTRFEGAVSARGGSAGGNGGFVEVSGKQSLIYEGNVDTRAPKGATGSLLLDPTNITIDSGPAQSGTLVNTAGVFTDPLTTPSNIKPLTLVSQLATSDVTVSTASGLGAAGTILVNSAVSWATPHSLTLDAASTLTIAATGSISNTGSGALTLTSGAAIAINGAVSIAGTVNLNASGVTQLATGIITAGTLAGNVTGITDLTGATNAIGAIGAFTSTGGNFSLNNGVTALSISGALDATGRTVSLTAASLGESAGGSIAANTFTGTFTGAVDLSAGTNAIANLGATIFAGPFSLNNGSTALNLTSAINAGASTVTLNAGNLTQTAAGVITAATLSGGSSGTTDLTGATNAIGAIGAFTSTGGNFSLDDGATALSITGALNATGRTVSLTAASLGESAGGSIAANTFTGTFTGPVDLSAGTNAIANLGATTFAGPFSLNNGSTALNLTSALNAGASTVTLNAGNLTQTAAGVVTAATLSGSSTGTTDLTTAANDVANLGAFASTSGNFAFGNGTHALNLAGALNAATHTVTLNADSLTQTAAGVVTAATLAGNVAGTTNLTSATNAIGAIGAFTSTGGNFSLNDGTTALAINGVLDATGRTVTLNAGPISEGASGLIKANTLTGTSSGAVLLGTNANAVVNLGAFTFNGNFAFNDGSLALNLTNAINAGANTVTLNAGNITQTAAGVITAATLSGSSSGTTDLTGAINAIGAIGAFTSTGGNFSLNNGVTALSISGALDATGRTVSLTAASLGESAGGSIAANTFTGTFTGAVDLSAGTNAIANLGATIFAGPFSLNNGSTALNLTSAINAGASTVTLNAGNLTQTAAGIITAATLSGGSSGTTDLTGATNAIGAIGAFTSTAGNFSLNDGATALSITGALNATGRTVSLNAGSLAESAGGSIAANTFTGTFTGPVDLSAGTNAIANLGATSFAGPFSLNNGSTALNIAGSLNAGANTVTLNAGNLTQTAAGVVTAATLSGSSTGSTDLSTAANNITNLGGFTSTGGNFSLNDGANSLNISGALNAATHTVSLAAANLTQTAAGVITAATLAGNVAGTTNLTSATNAIGAIGAFTSTGGNFSLNDGTTALAINGVLDATGRTVTLNAGPISEGASGLIKASTLTGTSSGAVLLGTNANAVVNLGAFTFNGNFAFNDGSLALNLTNAINAGANTVTLNAGNITQTAAGVITAATLSGSSTGTTNLTGATNAIGAIGAFTSTGGNFSLNDGTTALAINGVLDATGRTVTLNAGPISEGASGLIKASTLTGTSSGAVLLGTNANAVVNLGAFTFNGNFAFNDGSLALNLTNAINAGANTVTLNAGNITQTAAGVITAGTLSGSSSGTTDLTSATNAIGAIGAFTSTAGNFSLNDGATALSITGALNATGRTVSLNAGSLAESAGGSIAANTFTGTFTGPVDLSAGTNAIANLGATSFAGPFSLNNGSTALNIAGSLNAGANTVTLNAGNLTQTAAGVVTAATLSGSSTGSTDLSTAANNITNLGGFTSTGGNFSLNDGANSLNISGALNAATHTVSLAAANLTQTAAGVITAATLAGNVAGTTNLTSATNAIGAIGAFTSTGGNFSLNDGTTALAINGVLDATGRTVTLNAGPISEGASGLIKASTLTGTSSGAVLLGTNANAVVNLGAFTFNGNFAFNDGSLALNLTNAINAGANTVTLNAGNITQTAAGVITAATLSGSSTGTTNLTGATNAIGAIGAFTSTGGNFSLNDGTTALAINGVLDATGRTVTLNAGPISEGASGLIKASTLTGTSSGAVLLGTNANAVVNLGAFTFNGNFAFNDGSLALNLTNAINAGANTVTLNAGNITQTAAGVITAGTLSGSSSGTTDLTSATNAIGAIGAFSSTAGNFSLNDGATALSITGALNATGRTVSLNAGSLAESAGGSIAANTFTGTFAGAVDMSAGTNAIANLGATTFAGPFSLNNGSTALNIAGALNAGASTVTLNAGNLTQTAAGVITAATLSGSSTGSTDLSTAANNITNLGGFTSAGGNFSLNDGANSLNISGALNAATHTVSLAAANLTQTAAGVITAATLAGNVAATTNLSTASNAVANLGAFTNTGGNFSLNDGLTALTLTGALNAGTHAVTLNAGSLAQTIGGTINSATLSGSSSGTTVLAGANTVGALGPFSSNGALTFNSNVSLAVNGAVTTANNGLATISSSGGNLTVAAAGSVAGSGVSLTTTGAQDLNVNGAVNGNAGTVTLTSGRNIGEAATGTINTSGTLTIAAGGAIQLDQANTIGSLGAVTRGGNFTLNDAGGLSVVGPVTGGTTATSVSITTSGGALALGDSQITTTGAGNLTLSGSGVTQTAGGTLLAGGATNVAAGAGSIDLQSLTNHFGGAVTLAATGASAAIRDSGALTLAAPTLGSNTSLTAIAGTMLTLPAGAINVGSGDIDLRSLAGTLALPGSLSGRNIALTGTGGLTLAQGIVATNDVSLTTTNAPILEAVGSSITSGGATTFAAGTAAVTLAQANVLGSIGGTGGAVSIAEASPGGVALDNLTATSLTVATSSAAAPVSQTAGQALRVTGAVQINAGQGSGAVTLNNPANLLGSFGASAGTVSVVNGGSLTLNATTAASLAVDTSTGNGAITQAAPLAVAGLASFNAGTGNITLLATGNALGSFGAVGGSVSLTEGSANGVALDNVSASALSLNTSAASGSITQTAARIITVGGLTSINAGGGAVTLANAGNNFGSVAVSGSTVTLRDIDSIVLDTIQASTLTVDTLAGNGNVTQSGAATVSGATTIVAGSGTIALTRANDFGSVGATGGAVSITDVNALTLNAITAATLAIDTSAGNGSLSQTAPLVVSGATTVNAGTGTIALGLSTNDFPSLSVTGGAITVADSHALNLVSLTIAPNRAVDISSAGVLTLPATIIDTGTAPLSLSSGGALATAASLGGTNVSLMAGGPLTIGHDVNSLGSLALSTVNAPITQTAGSIQSSQAATVSAGTGDISLARAGNDFKAGASFFGGALNVYDKNDLTVTALTALPNHPVTFIANGSLTLPAVAIDTGTADLTLEALTGALSTGGLLSGANVTLIGFTSLTLSGNVTSSSSQTYSGQVVLAANATLDAGSGTIDLQQGAVGAGHDLTLTSSNTGAAAVHSGATISGVGQFTVNGNSSLRGDVASTGNQTYGGKVTLEADVGLNSQGGKIDLRAGVDASGHSLTLSSTAAVSDAIRAGAAIAGADQLTVNGKSTLATGVTTARGQVYTGAVTIGSSTGFTGTSLGFNGGIVANAFDLGLRTDALAIGGPLIGSGNATLSTLTPSASLGIAGGAGTLQVDQVTLDRFAGFAGLTVGRNDGSGNIAFGNVVLPTHLSVLSGSGNTTFAGTVSSAPGQSRNLGVSTAGITTFNGTVGGAIGGPAALGTLSVGGATALNASVTSNGQQTYGGNVTIGADATVSASALDLRDSLAVGSHSLTLFADAIGLAGTATGSGGAVRLASHDASGTIGIAGGAGSLQLSQALVDRFAGLTQLTIGRNDGTGAITSGSLTLPTDLTIASSSGSVTFAGTLDSAGASARDLTVNTAGTTTFAGVVGGTQALDALSIAGSSRVGGNVSAAAQTYAGAVTLTGDSTMTGGTIVFGSTVDGARALVVNAPTTRFGGAVGSTTPLASLRTDAAGTTELGGNVTTSGAQSYGDRLQLNADATLAASTLTLDGPVDGAHALGLAASGGIALNAPLGAGTDLTQLTITGPLQLKAGTVRTTGGQIYNGAVTLGAAAALRAASVSFSSSVDGPFRLGVQSPGIVIFGGGVGLASALDSLVVSDGGTVRLLGSGVTTTNEQTYSGALELNGSKTLRGSAFTFGGAVSGAADLALQTNGLSGATSLSGSGVLTITPIDVATSIGIAGGSGTLQVTQATLSGISGFTSTVIGAANGSGTINVGAATLRNNTTLQTDSGDINVNTSIDGPVALTLNSGGTTRISGPIGAITPLTSLTTDNNPNRADYNGTTGERTSFEGGGVRVATSGAQTYNDPVTAAGALNLSGGVITATQAANRFDGVVSANATSLALNASGELRLGAVTLANGGTITSDGVLHLTGSLRLEGGNLLLLSNATPQVGDLTDPDYKSKAPLLGAGKIREQSATIVQDAGATLSSAAGSLLVLRSPKNGSILLDRAGNTLLGSISASSGALNDNDSTRFTGAGVELPISVIRIVSSEIHVAGKPTDGGSTSTATGLEADTIRLTADTLTTGADGLIRARLIYNNLQGSPSSLPSLILELTPAQLAKGGGFGTPSAPIQVRAGGVEGGFITALPKGASGDNAVVFLAGDAQARPFYDGTGQINAVRIFFNGQATRTPQEAGALAAVIALIEDARHTRFEEAVRTENVSARLRSGVIAEVGAGRPATVGREGIRAPETCEAKPGTLSCP